MQDGPPPSSAPLRIFGMNVQELRQGKGWSQAALAERLSDALGRKIDATTITRIEKGTRPTPIHEAVELARVLDSTIDEILRPGRWHSQLISALTELPILVEQLYFQAVKQVRRFEEQRGSLSRLEDRARAEGLTVPPEVTHWAKAQATSILKEAEQASPAPPTLGDEPPDRAEIAVEIP